MKDKLIQCLEDLATKTNRSRNELINLLLEAAAENVKTTV